VTIYTVPIEQQVHGSALMIIGRQDKTLQIVIHTAALLAAHWSNMTQVLWMSPRLPECPHPAPEPSGQALPPLGTGQRFKCDLVNYLKAYKCPGWSVLPICAVVARFSFDEVKAVLIASVPGTYKADSDGVSTSWGWAAMKETLKQVPVTTGSHPEIVAQAQSIGFLGPREDCWLEKTLFGALSGGKGQTPQQTPNVKSDFKLMFPTADEVRFVLNGYESGLSLFTKTHGDREQRQVRALMPYLCHWNNYSYFGAGQSIVSSNVMFSSRPGQARYLPTYA